ncbi:MAG TPA: transcriptional repressor LexA [Ignavibacteria bacterium]|jgi:repressor LexA
MQKLTKRQQHVLEFIKRYIIEKQYSPTYKEIAENFGINVNAIQQVVIALIKKGFLEKVEGIARGLRLKDNLPFEMSRIKSAVHVIPLYGNVAAGEPIFADSNIEGYVAVEKPRRASGTLFSVTVRGDSMVDKKIVEKDKLIVRKQQVATDGDIVVALLDDEVTVKVFKQNGGKPYLQPANERYEPIRRPFKILGIVVGLIRDYTIS